MKFIYLLTNNNGHYKIGITENLDNRLSNINTSTPNKVVIVTAKIINKALQLEQEILQEYKTFKTNGEWFQLNENQVIEICKKIHLVKGLDQTNQIKNKMVKEVNKLLTEKFNKLSEEFKSIIDNSTIPIIENKLSTKPTLSAFEEIKEKRLSEQKVSKINKQIQDDQLSDRAMKIVMDKGTASASLLQRKLSIGYARAARILDILEDRGIIKGQEGSKPREIISPFPYN